MSNQAWKNPSGGFWPLGKITVANAGTPVLLNTNVGAQQEGTLQMARRIRQLIFSLPLTTTAGKKIYLLMKGAASKGDTNMVVAVITCGVAAGAATDPQPISVPSVPLQKVALGTPDQFSLDADENGASVQVTAIYE